MMPQLLRYLQAGVGPIASAGAQFLLSLTLLRMLSPTEFGSFAFLLVASQFSWGLWSALFCAPLPVLLSEQGKDGMEQIERCMLSTNLVAAIGALTLFFGLGLMLNVPPFAAAIFALYSGVALLRWLARAHAYALGSPLRTMMSDIAYSATLVAGIGMMVMTDVMMVMTDGKSLDLAYTALLASAIIGMLPFGKRYLALQFIRFDPRLIMGYRDIWRRHSGWSLMGVITTEATANAHVYLVTTLWGPAAFAPIAASALLIRPIGVAQKALNEFERAQMARQIGAGRIEDAIASVRTFRLVLVMAWMVTALAIAALLFKAPRLLFPPHYDLPFMIAAGALWLAVAGVRLVRALKGLCCRRPANFDRSPSPASGPLEFRSRWCLSCCSRWDHYGRSWGY
ncbi:hypothetical protein BF95_10680 [Sphingobium sp. Ant17]|nr:hypothetical protein BF95_10680 [Sphingobium sp. Ant17]